MALIKCSECGKEISDKATSCPNCGCPTKFASEKATQKNENTIVILFFLGISSLVGIVCYLNLRPPCLANAKERLKSPDSMKVVSWYRGTNMLEVPDKSGFGVRNRVKSECIGEYAFPK